MTAVSPVSGPTGASEAVWTERELLDRLEAKHAKISNSGPHWAFMRHVRDQAGFAMRTIDGLAMHLHPSRAHAVHAYEVKVSRSDFRRELALDCAKSAGWREWVDFFWIVAPKDVVPLDELPDGWGLIVPRGAGLTTARQAKRLHIHQRGIPAPDLPRSIVACMLRAAKRKATAND